MDLNELTHNHLYNTNNTAQKIYNTTKNAENRIIYPSEFLSSIGYHRQVSQRPAHPVFRQAIKFNILREIPCVFSGHEKIQFYILIYKENLPGIFPWPGPLSLGQGYCSMLTVSYNKPTSIGPEGQDRARRALGASLLSYFFSYSSYKILFK